MFETRFEEKGEFLGGREVDSGLFHNLFYAIESTGEGNICVQKVGKGGSTHLLLRSFF